MTLYFHTGRLVREHSGVVVALVTVLLILSICYSCVGKAYEGIYHTCFLYVPKKSDVPGREWQGKARFLIS